MKVRDQESFLTTTQSWTKRVLRFPKTMRVMYFTLEILTKHVGGQYVLELESSFPDEMLKLIGSNALANPLGKTFFAIYHTMYKTVNDLARWTDLWAVSVRKALACGDELIRDHVLTYILPQMFKFYPQSFSLFIEPLSSKHAFEDEDIMSVLIGCLKVGQSLAIDIESLINADIMSSLLRHSSMSLRVGGLSLITSSPQRSKPVQTSAFGTIKENMDGLLAESDSGYRNQVFGLIRQFIARIRGYAYAEARSATNLEQRLLVNENGKEKLLVQLRIHQFRVEEVNEFCRWFLTYVQEQIQPGCPYHNLYSGTFLIHMLVRAGLDNRVDSRYHEKQHTDFPFSIDVFNPTMTRLLIDNMTNNYEDIRQLTAAILNMAPSPFPGLELSDVNELAQRAKHLMAGMRGREGDGGARIIQLAFQLYDDSGRETFLSSIIDILEADILMAEINLIKAVHEHSVHGYYRSLRLIFEKIDYSFQGRHPVIAFNSIKRIVNSVSRIWEVAKPILCHDSPEGNIPEDIESSYNHELELKYGPATQTILSYSWRAVKESTSLLKVLFETLPNCLLSEELMLNMGDLILAQLASVKHRGAFSSVYPTFVACCSRCNNQKSLQHQPQKWLADNLLLIQTKAQYITRRSGGLPFLITAVLAADTDPNKTLLYDTFDKLIEVAWIPAISRADEKLDLPQVHAFNCIRTLVIEAELSKHTASLIDKSLELAISSFSNEIWAIRNCAVMLFTALQTRLFGARNESFMSAKLFFTRYKGVRPVLLKHLETHVQYLHMANESGKGRGEISDHVETVYPVLSLLSRLEGVNGYDGLNVFKPLIFDCLSSRIWKIREMASRTLTSSVTAESAIEVFLTLVERGTICMQNDLHGRCLAMLAIALKYEKELDMTIVFDALDSKFEEFVILNPLPETALSFVRVMAAVDPKSDKLLRYCANQVSSSSPSLKVKSSSRVLKREACEIYLRHVFDRIESFSSEHILKICGSLLFDSAYEVQLFMITFLDEKFAGPCQSQSRMNVLGGLEAEICTSLWKLFETSDWDQIRGPTIRLFGKLYAKSNVFDSAFLNIAWSTLYSCVAKKDKNTEEILEAALESLGFLTSQILKMDKDIAKATKLLELIEQNSDENEPYSTRLSALKSLIEFVHQMPDLTSCQFAVKFFIRLFLFLSDDYGDLRELCMQNVSEFLQLGKSTIAYCEQKLLDYISPLPGSTMEILKLFKASDGLKSLATQFSEALTLNEVLFTVEKQNLFRNELIKIGQYKSILEKVQANSITKSQFREWLVIGMSDLSRIIESHGKDGCLGWASSSPEIYLVIYRIKAAIELAESWELKINNGNLANVQQLHDFHNMLRIAL